MKMEHSQGVGFDKKNKKNLKNLDESMENLSQGGGNFWFMLGTECKP